MTNAFRGLTKTTNCIGRLTGENHLIKTL